MKRIAQILLTAFVAATAHVASALNYSPADLLLVFHKSGNNDVIFDIGPVAGFSGLAAGTVVPVSYDSSLVTSNFGGSLSGASFAVVGEKDSQSHVWLTDADTNSTPNEPTPSTYATVQAKVNSVGVNAALATGNNGSPFVVDPSDARSYSFIVSPDDSTAISTMEGNAPYVVSSVAPATAALYQLYPSLYSPTPTEVKLGTFTLAAGGSLSFTAAAVTPEITTLSGPGNTARGGTATYSVTADGATSFQWYLNGVAIAGATNSSLSVTNVQPGDAGNYTVAVNNSTYATTTTSAAKTLTETPAYIPGDLLLVFHDGINSDVEFNLGSVSSFQGLSAGSSKAVNYNKALVLSNFGGSLTGVTAAFVAESDSVGSIWLSDANLNTVGPDITVGTYAPLQSELNNVGVSAATVASRIDYNNPVVLDVTDARGWSDIVSHDDPTAVNSMDGNAPYTVARSFPGYEGFYQLSPNVTGSFAGIFVLEADGDISFTALTNTSVITAAAAPTILTQPAPLSLTTNEGAAKTYSVVASNSFPGGSAFELSYQWRLNGTNIAGATSSSYTDSNLQVPDEGNYSVVVSSINGSTTSSNALLALVLDSTIPTVVIKTPVANGFSTNGIVTGTATDAKVGGKVLLSKVLYGVDGGAVTNIASSTNNGAAWSFTIVGATPGNHTVVAQAQDLAGNLSLVRSNTFFYGVSSVLTVVTNGNGSLKGTASTFGTAVGGASLIIGKSYKVTAAAAGNYLFSNIVDSAAGPTTLTAYTFTMQSNLVLTLNFVTNRFFDAAGTYYGFLTNAVGLEITNSGFFTVKVTAKTNAVGKFTGTLYVDGNKLPIKGAFGLNGLSTGTIDRTAFSSKSFLSFQMALPFDTSDTISGSVSNDIVGGWSSVLAGDRALTTNTYDGRYTMVVPGDTNNFATVPGGSGYGLVFVTNNIVKTAGSKLADFQALNAIASTITKHGVWHLFSVADKVSGVYNSMIMGDMTMTNLSGTLTWIKLPVATGRYTAGFGVEADAYGSPYFADGNTALASQLVVPLTGGFGNLILAGAGLPSNITQTNSLALITGKNKFIFGVKTNNPNTIALSITPATGKVSGTFKPVTGPFATSTTTISGVVVTNLNSFRGFFTPLVGPTTESGSFELNP